MQTLRQEAKLAQVAVETTKTHWAVEHCTMKSMWESNASCNHSPCEHGQFRKSYGAAHRLDGKPPGAQTYKSACKLTKKMED